MKKELLAPAGNMKSLKAAIHGGADAIYIGMKEFGARKFANNFTRDEFIVAVRLCHLYGVKLYITMNTVVKDCEVDVFMDLVDFLYNNGADALLIQDFGMMRLVLDMYPDMEVHASTQFNNSSVETVKLLEQLGVKRVVLSRELSLEEIESIDTILEKEVFVHGALCISYSGNCLFSSMLGNRSGNRGECSGCCRLPYKLYQDKNFIKEGYLLSTKELNTSSKFDQLLKSDIKSFKLEGRMKSPEYVYFITKFYRNIVDGVSYTEEDLNTLKILFNRSFTTGNLFDDEIMNTSSPNHLGLKIGKVIDISKEFIKIKLDREIHQEDGIRFFNTKKGMVVNFLYDKNKLLVNSASGICYVKNNLSLNVLDDVYLTSSKYLSSNLLNYEERKVGVSVKFTGKVGEVCSLTIDTVTVSGSICQAGKTSFVDKDRIIKQLSKLGNTIYKIDDIDINISDNLFISMGELNELRRKCISLLDDKRCFFKRNGKRGVNFKKLDIKSTSFDTVIVNKEEELKKVLDYKRIYVNSFDLFNKYKDNKNIYYIENRNKFDKRIISRCLVKEYCKSNDSICDYSFNVTNIYSVYYLLELGFSCITLSIELNEGEINKLISDFLHKFSFYPNVEVVVKDRIELMIIKGNVLNLSNLDNYYLEDFKGRCFPVFFDGVNTHVLNYEVENRNKIFKCNSRYNYKYLK